MNKPNTTFIETNKFTGVEHSVRVTKTFREIVAGKISEFLDDHGNTKYFAESFMEDRISKGDFSFTFWTLGGAKLWLELVGLVEAK